MTLTNPIFLNGILDLGVVLAVAAIMLLPFRLDRRKDEASVYAFAAPTITPPPAHWEPDIRSAAGGSARP